MKRICWNVLPSMQPLALISHKNFHLDLIHVIWSEFWNVSFYENVKNYENLWSGYVGMFGHQCNIWQWFPIRFSILTWSIQYYVSFGMSNKDIARLICSVYSRGNVLIGRFRHCSLEVKSKLFKAYCTSFYGITTWSHYHSTVKNKLDVAYEKIFRAFCKYRREGTTNNMILNDVKPFPVTERHLMYGFIDEYLGRILEKGENGVSKNCMFKLLHKYMFLEFRKFWTISY